MIQIIQKLVWAYRLARNQMIRSVTFNLHCLTSLSGKIAHNLIYPQGNYMNLANYMCD